MKFGNIARRFGLIGGDVTPTSNLHTAAKSKYLSQVIHST